MTQQEFARQVGFSLSLWHKVLRGTRSLKWRNAKKVANIINGDPNLWREGANLKDRQRAWDAFCRQQQQS